MSKLKLMYRIMKTSKTLSLLYSFLAFFVLAAVLLIFIEPALDNIFDSLWLCFASVTTIGYGDFAVVTVAGRIITALISVYGIVLTAMITGTVVNYVMEINKIRAKESTMAFLDKLENLDTLSKTELAELSKRIKEHRFIS